jgi:voltage-gated sodium channel
MHKVVATKAFEYFTFFCVVLSSIILILQWYGADTTQLLVMEILNKIITVIFTLEVFLKIIGFGCSYWKNSWNILDFICTVFSWIDFLVQLFSNSTMTAAFKIIRLFRVIRFIRLIGRLRN